MAFFALNIFFNLSPILSSFLIDVPLQQTFLDIKNRPFMADFNNVSFYFN